MTTSVLKRQTCTGGLLALAALQLSACASIEELVSAPEVRLTNVEIQDLDYDGQTFMLSFDVSNPNPYPLPVNQVAYEVRLDGMRFAAGDALCALTIPANGDGKIALKVDLDLLRTAPDLLFVVRDATRRDIPYALDGSLAFDIPHTRPVRFSNEGAIRLSAVAF